ncbi:2-oxoacid:acceptor oxidoreductase family protein [Acetohalobium arabaticum]|uniref:Pyruvate/ketoisovalerate oxidoreductase n=1 Tax=Acetohalobium arabaticum (strain ATCC 49924 / DSM 5501 / Z-7288) TaxID=574087 RepID=D9QUU3_ACEAZ|nr:2-oxoacid:acceptor oxidoreductase family protein [Acetohalobium arabaticum]ADL12002.1 Pyruvate/ketoisovalerate oxidoreductase [Acetohalobium arabaticum DSM 5501]
MSKEQCEIILSGVGGQGLISSGAILGEAASVYEDKFTTMTKTYGVSARGGFSKSDVLISDEFVSYFKALNPDVILILDNKAYPEVKDKISEETLVIINSNEVDNYNPDLGNVYSFPLSEMAFEIGSLLTLNIIALGFIAGKTNIISKEALKKVVKKKYPAEKAVELNMKAIEKGFSLV